MATIIQLPKASFERHNAYAAETYQLISKEIPFVGDRYAKYKSGDAQIWLDSPHMNFQMKIMFMHDTFVDAFLSGRKVEMETNTKQEKSDLFGD